jgi:hypothetical protein
MQSKSVRSAALSVGGAAVFGLGGLCLVLLSMLGAPSFWYYPCFYVLPLLVAFWIWRPKVGAALSIGPLVAVIFLIRYLSGITLACAIVGLGIAVLCIVFAFRMPGKVRVSLIVSLSFLCASFIIDRLFTDKVAVRSYQVEVALDGKAPWGTVGREWSEDVKPVVLYRRVGDGYCYVAFKSQELHDRLASKNGATVPMQINIFKDFGREKGYSVRSIDGLLLASGKNVVRDAERFGGQMLGTSDNSAESCW